MLGLCHGDSAMSRRPGRDWQQMIRSRFADAFDTVDLLLTPTVPAMRKVIGEDMIGDLHYRTVLSWFTSIVNHALLPRSLCPCSGATGPPVSPPGDRADGLGGHTASDSGANWRQTGSSDSVAAIVQPG